MPGSGDLVVADHPAEAGRGHEHQAEAVVEGELQWLRQAVVRRLAEGFLAEDLPVELGRGPPVGDGQADDDG